MFNENTVLILGAGASVDYGFPLGHQLKTKICEGIKSVNFHKISEQINGWDGSQWENEVVGNYHKAFIYFWYSSFQNIKSL